MTDGALAPVSYHCLKFRAAIFGLLWKRLLYREPASLTPACRRWGISQALLGERMLLVDLIKSK